jgi:hypothetical protein
MGKKGYVNLEDPATVVRKSTILWEISPCSPLEFNLRFGGIYRLHLQVQKIIQARYQCESRWKT